MTPNAETRRRPSTLATILTVILGVFATHAAAAPPLAGSETGGQPTPLVVSALAPPRPVTMADGRVHLAYELSLVNQSNRLVTIEGIEVLDAVRGGVISKTLRGPALAAAMRISGEAGGAMLGPSHSGYLFLDVSLPADAPLPRALVHRLQISQRLRATPFDDHHGTPPPRGSGIEPSLTFVGAETPVEPEPAVVVAPPLEGAGWVVGNGCCAAITAHRGATLAIDGAVYVAQRFAIDFEKLSDSGTIFSGEKTKRESYPAFGVPVLAVADGVVVETRSGLPEQVPGELPKGATLETATGNHVVVDIGNGRFTLYAHLQPGSLVVKKGDRVRQGQVLGLLGNSGNSSAPHLHFQVMDAPSPLRANGLPFVFSSFEGEGVVTDGEALEAGKAATIDREAMLGPHRDQLPLNLQVLAFPAVTSR